ncbi:S8 family peptidase [Pseudomonas sp. CR3202]|uniref:S8 family peptidase n=1 Tax=Pseudomonas sp. CR3202 TaxID=3351532 RepID=UPI003BEFC347
MQEEYKHLSFEREELSNDRRPRDMTLPRADRGDIKAHAQRLMSGLSTAAKAALNQPNASSDGFILKLNYIGSLDFAHLHAHGVQFLSQEGKQMCVVFSDERGLATFMNHLELLGLSDSALTYRQILEALEGIDNWTAEDRSSWAIKNIGLPNQEKFLLDVELWPVETSKHPKRLALCNSFESWLASESVKNIDKVSLDSLLLYRLEATKVQAELLLNHRDVRLVDLTPKTGISYQQLNVDIEDIPRNIAPPPDKAARVCILDSGINTNHPLLKSSIGTSESFLKNPSPNEDDSGHGTAVAGIALYGDIEACLSSNYWSPQLWLLSGKILYKDPHGETVFDIDTIETTLIHAVEYFHKEYNCRIFNLSIGNLNSPYDGRHIRGIAYILDNLARKLDVLFIVSAGNFGGSESPQIPANSWKAEYPGYLIDDASVIIDPAPALNVLTVGSLARHNSNFDEQRYPEINALSPASENQPSPFTRHGPSVRGAIKPEIVAPGGNLASPMRHADSQWKQDKRGLGVLTLHNEFVGRTLLKEISGTSFAAPYVTHLAGRLLNEYPDASANLLRAMLVNHCNLPHECVSTFTETERKQYSKSNNNRELPREIAGYGAIDEDALYRSSDNTVLIYSEDVIEDDTHHFFELPLPASFLRRGNATREIRVTLAHTPAVRTTRLDYTATRINFRLVKGSSLEEVQLHFNKLTKDDYETRNDDAAPNRTVSSQIRDKGTVQSSYWKFQRRNPDEKWFVVVTRQDRDWGKALSMEKEAYALVVTATDRENMEANLYVEIREIVRVRQQARGRVRQ